MELVWSVEVTRQVVMAVVAITAMFLIAGAKK